MTGPDPQRPEPGPDASVADIEADIERTRAELGETVGALSDKLDVKQRVSDKTDEIKHRAQEKVQPAVETVKNRPVVPAAGIAAVVLVVVGVIAWRRRRS